MSLTTRLSKRTPARAVAAVVIGVLSLLFASQVSSANGSDARHGETAVSVARPTIVLVHGAFADSSGWNASVSQLQASGYPVVAPANPLRGLTADAEYIRAFLQNIPGPIVLVGHSYGGAVITNAARGVPNVKALVYVGAFVPDTGEAIGTMLDPAKYPGSLLTQDALVVRPTPNPAAASGQDGDVYIALDKFRSVFAGDVSQRRSDQMARTQRPLALTANFEPSGEPAWKSIPSWDLVTMQDRAIPPSGQFFMARRADSHISTVDSAHDVMVSHPDAVTAVVLQAARAIS